MPMASAANSSSRTYFQARPSREFSSRRTAKMLRRTKIQDQVVVLGCCGTTKPSRCGRSMPDRPFAPPVMPTDVVHQQHPDDLAECDGHDGQVVAAQVQDGPADTKADQAGHDGAPTGRPSEDRNLAGRVQNGDGVGADAVEGGVAELEQAGVADDDVEAEAQQDVDAGDAEHARI